MIKRNFVDRSKDTRGLTLYNFSTTILLLSDITLPETLNNPVSTVQSWTWLGFIHMDWIGWDWIQFLVKKFGLDWVRSFVPFIGFPKTQALSSSVCFR